MVIKEVEYKTEFHSRIDRNGETWWAQIKITKRWMGFIPMVRTIPVDLYLLPKGKDGRPKFPGGSLYGGYGGRLYLGSAYDCREDVEEAATKQLEMIKSGEWDVKYSTFSK